MVNGLFAKAVITECAQSIDEQMIIFTESTSPSGMQQYMPLKLISHGFKLWAYCGISEYTHQIELYTGKISKPVQASSPLEISFASDLSESAINNSIASTSSTKSKRSRVLAREELHIVFQFLDQFKRQKLVLEDWLF